MQIISCTLLGVVAVVIFSACGSSETVPTSTSPLVVFPPAPGAGSGGVDADMYRDSLLANNDFRREIRFGAAMPVSPSSGNATFNGYVFWDALNPLTPPQTRTVGNLAVDAQFDSGLTVATIDGFRDVVPGRATSDSTGIVYTQLLGAGSIVGNSVDANLTGGVLLPGAGTFPVDVNLSGLMYSNGFETYVGGNASGAISALGGPISLTNGGFFATD